MPDLEIAVAVVAAVGAIAAGSTALRRPILSLGILFLLASLSRATLETPIGTMRLEQPAIAVVAVVLLVGGRLRVLRRLSRSSLLIAAGFAAYLGILGLSSVLDAPDRGVSLRIVAWLAISMVGGVEAFILSQGSPGEAIKPLGIVGGITAASGVALAALFLIGGGSFDLGIQGPDSILPRVTAFVWEANLYASFLTMCLPFSLESMRRHRRAGALLVGLVVVGVVLGDTRGAYLGGFFGLVAYAAVRWINEPRPANLARQGALIAGALVVGVIAFSVLLPNPVERYVNDGGIVPPATLRPGSTPKPGPAAPPSLEPYPDTVTFRLERVSVALADLGQSPLIGLGAESFGQRHADPSQGGLPDHIAILALAALYDAGILGAAALALAFVTLLVGLWKAAAIARLSGNGPGVGLAAAFVGAIVSVLVSYEATNALHFAINWIVVGCAFAVLERREASRTDETTMPQSDTSALNHAS